MTARIAVVMFPGSNCEHDVVEGLSRVGAKGEVVYHSETSLDGYDAVVVPGGFAHGDYLRPGAIARFSPVMAAVSEMAREGFPVIGICNGFQILTEAGLLPGALQKNSGLKFLCQTVELRIETTASALTNKARKGDRIQIPINHFEGNYTCDDATLARLKDEDRVVFRYTDNPNGARDDIAGICNEARNVVGLMPHPERASDLLIGSDDGLVLLSSLVEAAGVSVSLAAGRPNSAAAERGARPTPALS